MESNDPSKSPSKKIFVRRMFDDIHGKYDIINTILSFGLDRKWRRRTIEEFYGNQTIVDLCGGGGQLASILLEKDNFEGDVIILDFSINMLKMARKIIPQKYSNRTSLVVADAEDLPIKSNKLEGAMSSFCLRNLSDLRRFSNETNRILIRNGRAFFLEIAHPRNRIVKWFFELYFYKIASFVSGFISGKRYAYKYLPLSLKKFPPQKEVLIQISDGWRCAGYQNLSGGMAAIYKLEK